MANSHRCESSERQNPGSVGGDPIIVRVLDGLSSEPPSPPHPTPYTPSHSQQSYHLIDDLSPQRLHHDLDSRLHALTYTHTHTLPLFFSHTQTHTHELILRPQLGWERQSQTQVVHSCMMGMDWCSCLLVQWSSELELLSGTQCSVERSRPQQQSTRRNSLRMSLLRSV